MAQQAPYAIERGDTVELGRVYALKVGGRELIYHGDVNRMTRKLKATIYRHALIASGRYQADEIADADADRLADAFDRAAGRRDDYSYNVATCTELATGTARKTHDYSYDMGGGVIDLDTVTVVEVRAGQIVEPTEGEHDDDCQFCAAGEGSVHTYEPPTEDAPTRYGQSFPAMTGDVVTQGHTDHCARNGHATWTADGVDKGVCPRCGELTETKTEPEDRMADHEDMERVDAALANGLESDRKGSTEHGGSFHAILLSTSSEPGIYGYSENGYGQRAYLVFASDDAAREWFDEMEDDAPAEDADDDAPADCPKCLGIVPGPTTGDVSAERLCDCQDAERVMVSDQDYDAFRSGYVTAMLWANTIVSGESEDVAYQYQGPGRWWEDAPVKLDDANAFLRANLDKLQSVGDADMSQHGHDFALTRNGHGAGFWDRGYGVIGDELTEAAKAYGEAWVILDDDAADEL